MYLLKRAFFLNYFRDMFTLASQIHSYNTQKNSAYSIYLNVELIFENSQFGYMVEVFNSLSREVQNSESISLLGKRLKKSLLS